MSSAGASTSTRPTAMKRNSSQGTVPRAGVRSPGSELDLQPLRHQVRPKGHARIVLPRNHSSGRNLAKLARQVAAAGGETANGRAHARQRSHEGDTEIRLPGSLDESEIRPPPIRRNYTASNLPRNSSHTKLKKNLSHGALQRLGTASGVALLTSTAKTRVPLSPGIKGKSKRPRSMDWDLDKDKDLHTREVELAQQQQERREGPKRVGFAVGSAGNDDANRIPAMEGSGLDEGEWTEESASISPFSTRQNTANNSRRESIAQERPAAPEPQTVLQDTSSETETDTETEDTAETALHELDQQNNRRQKIEADTEADGTPANSYTNGSPKEDEKGTNGPPYTTSEKIRRQSQDVEYPLPIESRPLPPQLLRRQSAQVAAPALISNVNVMDDTHSMRTSPAASLRSARSIANGGSQDPDELVSRFVASTSTGSGTTTTMQNTPKSGSFHDHEQGFAGRGRGGNAFSLGPVSPGSTISGSSGATTPAFGRSRTELKLLQEKALADMEVASEGKKPLVPAHVYDRRNESLKSYLQLAVQNNGNLDPGSMPLSMGPEIFQGRFKAVNTELKVVQMYRDPIAESLTRLRARQQGSKGSVRSASQKKDASSLRMSKSAVTLPVRTATKKDPTSLSTSTTPPTEEMTSTSAGISKPILTASKSSLVVKPGRRAPVRGVSFAGAHEHKEIERSSDESSLDDIVKELWDSVMT